MLTWRYESGTNLLEAKTLIFIYFQLENCARPAIITKDLSMIIYGRDARTGPRSLKHLFSGQYRNPEANRLSGVYELSLRRASDAGSPGRSSKCSRCCYHCVFMLL